MLFWFEITGRRLSREIYSEVPEKRDAEIGNTVYQRQQQKRK